MACKAHPVRIAEPSIYHCFSAENQKDMVWICKDVVKRGTHGSMSCSALQLSLCCKHLVKKVDGANAGDESGRGKKLATFTEEVITLRVTNESGFTIQNQCCQWLTAPFR